MVEKKDIDELEAIYKKVTTNSPNITDPPIQQQSQTLPPIVQSIEKTVQQLPTAKPSQEVRTNETDSFVPIDVPTDNLDVAIEKFFEDKKQREKKAAYRRLLNMLYQPENMLQQQPQPQPVVQQVLVKDNSDAIRAIDLEIMNPENKDLNGLINAKRRLQGLPLETKKDVQQKSSDSFSDYRSSYENSSTKKVEAVPKEKVEKNYGWKFALGLSALLGVITFAIFYTLLIMGH